MPYLGRAAPAPPRRVPAPYGPSQVPDIHFTPPPWAAPKPPPEVRDPTSDTPADTPGDPASYAAWDVTRDMTRDMTRDPVRSRRGPAARTSYDALESHGRFELIDTGELTGGARAIVLRLPRRSRGFVLSPRVGDVIWANAARGTHAVGARLDVQFVTRHK